MRGCRDAAEGGIPLIPVVRDRDVQIGDVWVHGGSPGHAMLVVDMAADRQGRKICLLAQSYMQAQDIHLVINPGNQSLSPWYEIGEFPLYTPEWTFYTQELRTWTNFVGVSTYPT